MYERYAHFVFLRENLFLGWTKALNHRFLSKDVLQDKRMSVGLKSLCMRSYFRSSLLGSCLQICPFFRQIVHGFRNIESALSSYFENDRFLSIILVKF